MRATWDQMKSVRPKMAGNWVAPLIFISMMAVVLPSRAVDNTLPELRSSEQLRRVPAEQAERHYPVRLRGVITFFDQRIPTKAYRFIQDDTAGIYFYMDPEIASQTLKPGQTVEIEGETGQGEFAPVVVAHHIQILGEGKFPEPKQVSFESLASGQEDSQFVETCGIIHSVQLNPQTSYHILEMATGDGRLTVYTSHIPVERSEDLVDSNVRVMGICITHFNLQRQLFD